MSTEQDSRSFFRLAVVHVVYQIVGTGAELDLEVIALCRLKARGVRPKFNGSDAAARCSSLLSDGAVPALHPLTLAIVATAPDPQSR